MRQVINFNNINWPLPVPPQPFDDKFRIIATESSTVSFTKISTQWSNFQYSTDGSQWTSVASNFNMNLSAGEKIYFRAKQIGNATEGSNYTQFNLSGGLKIAGDLMYLHDYENISTPIQYTGAFLQLFDNCSALKDAGDAWMSSTTLTTVALNSTFRNSGIVNPPDLQFTSVGFYGCYETFYGCTSMITGPILRPLNINQNGAYEHMFENCSSLTSITCLATSLSGAYLITDWLKGTASSGILYKNPNSTLSYSDYNLPSGWTTQNYQN